MKRLSLIVLTLFMLFGSVTSAAAFSDVVTFKEEIKRLTDLGIINGYEDGTFRPNNHITRAQTVIMIVREMGLSSVGTKTSFIDVKKGSNGYEEIAFAVEKGFISGFSDGTFRPNEKLTRAQMAKILVKAYNLNSSSSYQFNDVQKGYWAEPFISTMALSGVTYGFADNTFRPEEFVSRGQFSAFLSRVLDIREAGEEPDKEPGDGEENPGSEEPPGEDPVEPGTPNETPATITYKGLTDAKSQYADNKTIRNLNHYVVNMGEGNPIDLYVTDDYENRYGKGFAYDETISIIESIEKYRNEKPYTARMGTLKIFFYTNESNTPLPSNYQAVTGSWYGNQGAGMPTEMLINGSNMPYDFRTTFVHEFFHYFDFQSFITLYQSSFAKYWGNDYSFWLLEGGAEYGSYFFYDYPKNTKNHLREKVVQMDREQILNYAIYQSGGKTNILYNMELDSFDDIYEASANNYGVTLSLFWYLVEQYGYEEVYDYVRFVGETFKTSTTITQSQKDETARKFLGKTEKEVLKDWLEYFNYFNGELQEFEETTIGIANHVLQKGGSLNHPQFDERLGIQDDGSYIFAVNIEGWVPEYGDSQAMSFSSKSTISFTLSAEGYESVDIKRNYHFYTGTLLTGEPLYAFGFEIPASEQTKLVKGVKYNIIPHNNDSIYQWIISDDMLFEW